MTTVNISLTPVQAKLVNRLTNDLGFANRSEFFRALIRRISVEPALKTEIQGWSFLSLSVKSKDKIINSFKKSNKYSKEFLKDLTEGLNSSDYFEKRQKDY